MLLQVSYYILMLKSHFAEEEGQDLIEYALIAGLLALAAVAGLLERDTGDNLEQPEQRPGRSSRGLSRTRGRDCSWCSVEIVWPAGGRQG